MEAVKNAMAKPNMALEKVPMPERDPKERATCFEEVAKGYTPEMAMEEATRCLNCKAKPCVAGCPVGVRIPEFIQQMAAGNFLEAYQIITSTNSLPAVCGRVCPQESQCEGKCVRGKKGQPVGIGRLERFAADYAREHGNLQAKSVAPNGHKVAVVGGGLGCAIAYPQAKKLHEMGCQVDLIAGFRSKDIIILEDEMKAACTNLYVVTDDGSNGRKALVTQVLKELIDAGHEYDAVIAIGPMIMMKFVCETTRPYGIKTIVSMNTIMVDGTGMCGGCRLIVGGETKFACVDGPDFDGHLVDFDGSMRRGAMYKAQEKAAVQRREEHCNLFKKEVK